MNAAPLPPLAARQRNHRYDPDPRDTVRTPRCTCGMASGYRGHQPAWWRVLHPLARWR